MDDFLLRKKAMEGVVQTIASDNVGIYPQAVQGGEHPYEKRTEKMEGWNDAVMQMTKDCETVGAWLKTIPLSYKTLVEDLLITDKIEAHVTDGTCSLWVNCSDTFWWGTADAEDLSFDDLGALSDCYQLSPKYGGELWCARKRKMRPQTASYVECYPKSEWSLFDACGPERDDSDGKGRSSLT